MCGALGGLGEGNSSERERERGSEGGGGGGRGGEEFRQLVCVCQFKTEALQY